MGDRSQAKFHRHFFKAPSLKRLESSVAAFRLSWHWALTFEDTYLDYLLCGRVVDSADFRKAMRNIAVGTVKKSAAIMSQT